MDSKLSTTSSDIEFIEQLYACTLDPAAMDDAVNRWVERVGTSLVLHDQQYEPEIERHIKQAMELFERLDPEVADPSVPEFFVDAQGVIVKANVVSREQYTLDHYERIDQFPFSDAVLREIKQAMKRGSKPASERTVRALIADRTDTDRRLLLTIAAEEDDLVRITSSELIWSRELESILSYSFQLTSAEVAVVREVVEGSSIEQVANTRGTTIATVRAQIRAIYEKTGVSSLPEMIRLMMGATFGIRKAATLPTIPQTHAGSNDPFPRDEDRNLLQVSGGRMLDYSIFGNLTGRPVLFMHDEVCSDGWTAQSVTAASSRQLRIIAPLRASYGRSDGHLRGSNQGHRQTVEDILILLDHLKIEKVVVLSHIMGGSTSLYFAEVAPERIAGIVGVLPPMPPKSEHFEKIHPLNRMMIHTLINNPSLHRFMVRVRGAYARRYGLDRYLQHHFAHPIDRRLLADPVLFDAVRHGARNCWVNGVQGFISDLSSDGEDSASVARKLALPTMLVIGDQDRNGRGPRAQAVIDAGANAELIVLPDASELVLYQHMDKILDMVAKFADEINPCVKMLLPSSFRS